jgi:hypothetical protein
MFALGYSYTIREIVFLCTVKSVWICCPERVVISTFCQRLKLKNQCFLAHPHHTDVLLSDKYRFCYATINSVDNQSSI